MILTQGASALVLSALALSFTVAQECYWPDGSIATQATPCNVEATNSHCCGVGDTCLSNGYCLQNTGIYANRLSRAGCTDYSWASQQCPQFCQDGNCSALMNKVFMSPTQNRSLSIRVNVVVPSLRRSIRYIVSALRAVADLKRKIQQLTSV